MTLQHIFASSVRPGDMVYYFRTSFLGGYCTSSCNFFICEDNHISTPSTGYMKGIGLSVGLSIPVSLNNMYEMHRMGDGQSEMMLFNPYAGVDKFTFFLVHRA